MYVFNEVIHQQIQALLVLVKDINVFEKIAELRSGHDALNVRLRYFCLLFYQVKLHIKYLTLNLIRVDFKHYDCSHLSSILY